MNTIKKKPVSAIEPDDLPAINTVLAKGYRVELIPVKDRIKVVRVRREEVKK